MRWACGPRSLPDRVLDPSYISPGTRDDGGWATRSGRDGGKWEEIGGTLNVPLGGTTRLKESESGRSNRLEQVEPGFARTENDGIARLPCTIKFLEGEDEEVDRTGKRGHRAEDVGNPLSRARVLAPIQHDEDVRIRTWRRTAGPQRSKEEHPPDGRQPRCGAPRGWAISGRIQQIPGGAFR